MQLDTTSAVFSKRTPEDLFAHVRRLASEASYYEALSDGGIRNGEKYEAEEIYDKLVMRLEEALAKRTMLRK